MAVAAAGSLGSTRAVRAAKGPRMAKSDAKHAVVGGCEVSLPLLLVGILILILGSYACSGGRVRGESGSLFSGLMLMRIAAYPRWTLQRL